MSSSVVLILAEIVFIVGNPNSFVPDGTDDAYLREVQWLKPAPSMVQVDMWFPTDKNHQLEGSIEEVNVTLYHRLHIMHMSWKDNEHLINCRGDVLAYNKKYGVLYVGTAAHCVSDNNFALMLQGIGELGGIAQVVKDIWSLLFITFGVISCTCLMWYICIASFILPCCECKKAKHKIQFYRKKYPYKFVYTFGLFMFIFSFSLLPITSWHRSVYYNWYRFTFLYPLSKLDDNSVFCKVWNEFILAHLEFFIYKIFYATI